MEIKNLGLTTVEGKTFNHVEGGFGEGSKCMLARDIAEIHGQKLGEINRRIGENISRFNKDNDIKDILAMGESHSKIKSFGFSQQSINASNNIYLLSERGYAKLLKLMEDDLAWEMYDKLVDGYFTMRANKLKIPQTYAEALLEAGRLAMEIETLSLENKTLINENDLLTGKASRQEYLSVIHGFVKTIQNELQLQNGWIVLYDTCTKINKIRIDKYYLNYCEVNKVELKTQGYKRADLSSGVKCISTFATNEQLTELFKIGKRIIEDKKIMN